MNYELPMSQRCRKTNPSPSVFLPDDLIVEILCLLRVKPLMKMKCVSKSWKTLISDPKFVKMHLDQSSQNSLSYVVSSNNSKQDGYSFVPFSVNDLLENGSITFPDDPYYRLIDKDCRQVVGSCNGLVCLLGYSLAEDGHKKMCFRLWNPATRTISDKLGYFREDMNELNSWKFIFGYDNSTDTYKVVALYSGNIFATKVRVLSFGDKIWRNIQSSNAKPVQFVFPNHGPHGGVHLNCTVNWLAMTENGMELVIISLDLTTETHTPLLPPLDPNVGILRLGVCVLMNSLCFYHDFEGTDYVIWMMTEFGDEKSWTQFLKFSYQNLQININRPCFNLYANGDTRVFTKHYYHDRVIFYNWRNHTVLNTRVDKIRWFSINNYVESLIPTC